MPPRACQSQIGVPFDARLTPDFGYWVPREPVPAQAGTGHDDEFACDPGKETPMKRQHLTEKLLDIKREKGWS